MKKIFSKENLIISLCLSLVTNLFSEHAIVTEYVRASLDNNNLIQEQIQKESAIESRYKQTVGNFLPSLSLQSRYSRSEGGRTFELPLGDIINPIYQTLGFPNDALLDNQEISLMPEEEFETKLSLIQPIFNPSIYLGNRIAKKQRDIQHLTRKVIEIEIAKAVRLSYYSWVLIKEAQIVYELSLKQAQKQLYITEKLNEAGMVTTDAVLAMQSDVLQAEQDIRENRTLEKSVRWEINKILNRPLESSLKYLDTDTLVKTIAKQTIIADTISNNKIRIIETSNEINLKVKNLAQLQYLPTIALTIDAGVLSEDFNFKDDGFITGSLILQWDLFSGLKRKNIIAEAKNLQKANEFKLFEEKNEVQKSIKNYSNQFNSCQTALIPAEKLLETSKLYYERILNSYKNGTKTASDLSEAHLKFNKAALNLKKKQIDVLLSYSHLLSSQDKCFE